MKSALRATAVLGTSSIVSILVGLVSAKAFAMLLGPSGLGFMSLLQALVGLSGLIAGMGIGSGLIRMGAHALSRQDHVRAAALFQAIWLLLWVLGGFTLLILVLFRTAIGQWMLGGTEHAGSVVLMGIALLFNLASGLQTSILNTYHRVEALARIGITNSVLGTATTLALVWLWREQGIVLAVIVSGVIGWAISTYFLRQEIQPARAHPPRDEVLKAAWSLLRFGVPYTASMAVGTGVQFALPALVLHTVNAESVGFYRAASSISGVYLGFLLTSMGQDYYPRISAISDKPAELVHLVNQQHRLVMLLSVPMILGTLALSPYLVPLIFSSQFYPAVEILEWQLIGDLFKFSSWTMGFVILSRSSSVTLFFVELIAGVNILVSSWLGIHWFGLAGLGIGFLATYMVHYLITWLIVRKSISLVWSTSNKQMFAVALLAALIIRGLPSVGLENLRTPVALLFALVAGTASLYVIWQEIGKVRDVQVSH